MGRAARKKLKSRRQIIKYPFFLAHLFIYSFNQEAYMESIHGLGPVLDPGDKKNE